MINLKMDSTTNVSSEELNDIQSIRSTCQTLIDVDPPSIEEAYSSHKGNDWLDVDLHVSPEMGEIPDEDHEELLTESLNIYQEIWNSLAGK